MLCYFQKHAPDTRESSPASQRAIATATTGRTPFPNGDLNSRIEMSAKCMNTECASDGAHGTVVATEYLALKLSLEFCLHQFSCAAGKLRQSILAKY